MMNNKLKNMKRLFGFLKFKNKKNKVMVGKKVKLVRTAGECTPSSNNKYIGSCMEFTIDGPIAGNYIHGPAWTIKDIHGANYGWAYEWEMEEIRSSKESLELNLNKLKTELEEVQRKIDFLNETGSETFDSDEYKVYSTLKLLDNDKLSTIEKSKVIAGLIKGK